jgi:hypothetical protein
MTIAEKPASVKKAISQGKTTARFKEKQRSL